MTAERVFYLADYFVQAIRKARAIFEEGKGLQWLLKSVDAHRKRRPDFRQITVDQLCKELPENVVSVDTSICRLNLRSSVTLLIAA